MAVAVRADPQHHQRHQHQHGRDHHQCLPCQVLHHQDQEQAAQHAENGGHHASEILSEVTAKPDEDLDSIVVYGKLATEKHQQIQTVQDEEWFEIVFA